MVLEIIMVQSMPDVTPCYDDLFTSLSLSGVAGVILYREYSDAAGVTHAISIGGTTAQSFYNPTRDMVDSYLCYDGKPRWTSPVFISDHNMYDEFANRDHRLWLHVTPPYVVVPFLRSASCRKTFITSGICFTDIT